ncbi:hypothetical protein DB347_11295 [Opitutaceae bacterium EW11]|nr:hypothetical protein DB347_11295 [Opitutaceae bacterium EW11]
MIVLQHATVVLASVLSSLGCYVAFSSWAPRHRWTAWIVSVCFVLSPAALALLCIHDMYMSFLAAAWIPLAFHAARRMAESRSVLAAAKLAAVLAVILNCHPPVGLWTAIVSFGVAFILLACRGTGWRAFALPGATAVFLYALNAFQFQGISEISPVGGLEMPWRAAVPLISAGFVFCGVIWFWARRRRRSAEGKSIDAGAAGSDTSFHPWSGAVAAVRANAVLAAIPCALLVLVAARWLWPAPSPVADATVAFTKNFWPGILLPVHAPAGPLSDVQPGWALLLLGVLGLMASWFVEDATTKLLAGMGALLTLCLLPVTPVAAAFWSSVPVSLIASTSGAVNLRITPVWAAAMAFGGFGALVWLGKTRPWASRIGFCAMALLAVWSVREARKIQRFSESLLHSPAQTKNVMRPENSVLTIYSGNFIGLPPYFSHGVRDYHFESRLLDPGTGEPNPALALGYKTPEPRETLILKAEPDAALPGWLSIGPKVQLAPGGRVLLTFAFSRTDWAGILVIEGQYFYREYILPSSGEAKAFGCAPGNGKDLVIWSTAPEPQVLTFRFRPEPAMPNGLAPQVFASVEVRAVSAETLPVRTSSLVPTYKAQANVTGPAVLETPRTWIPGYRATLNGHNVDPLRSVNNLVSVPLVPGPNSVELSFVGSRRLQLAFFVSFASWVVFLALWMAGLRRSTVTSD